VTRVSLGYVPIQHNSILFLSLYPVCLGPQEYLTPDEVSYFDKTGSWPKGRRPCILCHRAAELSRLVSLLEVS
jgi:hypothetical protein